MNEQVGPYRKVMAEGQYDIEASPATVPLIEVGKRGTRRVDGYAKASGKALYTRDLQLPGMLYARMLRCPYPHARIISIDTSRAEALPGVRAIIRYDDPEIKGKWLNGSYFGPNSVCPEFAGWALKPVRLILADEGWWEGQPMGVVVAADSEEIALEAIRVTKIDWEELPFILDHEEAARPDAYVLPPGAGNNEIADPRRNFKMGDVEKGFAEADQVIEFYARRRPHLWAGAELPSVLVQWLGDGLEIWMHQQQPYIGKQLLAEALNLPMDRITVNTVFQGCSFGERGNPADVSENGINILATLLSQRTSKPVKVLYDRRDTFLGESSDTMSSWFKVGFKNDGTITAVKIKNVFSLYAGSPGGEHFVDNTRIPNIEVEAISVDVSLGPVWWCRCEQLPNTWCLDLVCDQVAAALSIDPTIIAIKNDGCHGHDTSYLDTYKAEHGFPMRDSLKECIEVGKKAIGWDEQWHQPGTKMLPNGKLHGIAFTWDHEWDDVRGTGSAAVLIENDGSVIIIGHQVDIGPNPWTPLCQIVADEIGVPFDQVRVKAGSSDLGFALMSPDGSCNLTTNGNIVRKAAQKARAMLLDLASEKFEDVKPEDLDVREGIVFVKSDPSRSMAVRDVVAKAMPMHVSCLFWSQAPVAAWAWHTEGLWGQSVETNRPRLCRQVHFMEVEVDPDTGEVEVKHVVNVQDVGKAVSPEATEGQMYGGSYMGVGRGLTEEMVWDPPTGVLLNGSLIDYKYATILDCGQVDATFLETALGHGPYGSCGVGEDSATVVPALVGFAVYNAIGTRIDEYPITPARILKALGKI